MRQKLSASVNCHLRVRCEVLEGPCMADFTFAYRSPPGHDIGCLRTNYIFARSYCTGQVTSTPRALAHIYLAIESWSCL